MSSPATGPMGLVLEVQLRQLLFAALSDGTIYSALVPWVLDSDHKGLTLLQHAQERQCLQHVQLQAGKATPQDMQHCVLQVVAEACQHAAALLVDACSPAAAGARAEAEPMGATVQPSAKSSSKQQPIQQLSAGKADNHSSSSCTSSSLSQPASRLAKLHGHLLSHLAAPNLAAQLHQLLLLLTAGPLDSAISAAAGGKQTSSNSKQGADKQAKGSSHVVAPAASKSAHQQSGTGSAAPQAPAAVSSPQQVLPCRACAARYAAKALECCSKLLSCMPGELQQALVSSRHLQHYSPALVTLLTKNLAAGAGSNAAGNTGSLPPAATPWQQQHQGHAAADCTPAAAGVSSAGRPGVLGWATAGTPGSGGNAGGAAWLTDAQRSLPGSGSKGGARQGNRTPASARLSGLGLLMPNTPGTGLASRPASAGQLPAGGKAAKTAAVCNREKSRDTFFTILRRASSRLDTIRQAQDTAAAAAGEGSQQAEAAEAAAAADMAELLSEVGVAAKQLLLQLAPSNLGYLAELFMACVLQAASTGEPLLEPALVMIAEKDPSRFQKLQQRLGDRPSGIAMAPSAGVAATPGGGSSSSNRPAGRTGPGSGKQQQQRQAAKQAGQQQIASQQRDGGELGADSLAASKTDGLVHVMHARARGRPAKNPQQQPHILATAGAAASAHPMAAAAGPSSGTAVQQQPMHSRHIIPQPSTAQHSQPQQGSAVQQQVGKAGAVHSNGYMSAASPVPLAVAGAADSPLPASCLSPLFAAASESPLTAAAATGLARGAAARHCGSPLIKNSSNNQTGQHAAPSALLSSKLSGNGMQQGTVGGSSSSLVTPAARVPAIPAAGIAGAQKAGAATALAKGSRPPAGAAAGGSGPHSAPPKLQAALGGSNTAGTGAAAVLAQHGPGPAQVMLQCLQLMPAGQHVLVLLLHAADSSSFNRALLGVTCSRVEKLLCSSPASFTAASGLGQQASAIVALGSYCSYLAFAAGAADVNAAGAAEQTGGGPLLQQQPLLDIATMLQRLLASAVSCSVGGNTELQQGPDGSQLDAAWRLALAVPFAVSCMRLAELNHAAANSPCMQAALQTLQALRCLPALGPTTPGFGALPVCVGCCIQSCHLGQMHPAAAAAAGAAGTVSSLQDELSLALSSGSCLVDSLYWSICCPGLQQLVAVLNVAATAASASPSRAVSLSASALHAQQQRQLQDKTPARASELQDVATAGASDRAGTDRSDGSHAGDVVGVSRNASAAHTAEQTPQPKALAAAPAAAAGAKSNSSTSSSPAGAAAARHTTPLLLAPRAPPEMPSPPAVMVDALAAVSDPVRQQLQQAFISQYSTDDNPVKMRDVLTVINGILFANSLSKALSQGLPAVLQKHLDLLQQAVEQQLAPATQGRGGGSTTQLQGQDLARAVHALYTDQLSAALPEALEAAMQAAADHACQAAAAACGALLPADVPPAAATTAAAMVTASCKASCAQRLLQEVPVLVQSTLADAADDLARLVNRQWAVHARMTAGAAAGPALGAVPCTDSSSSIKSNSASSVAAKQPIRLQPVKLDSASAGAGTLTAVCSDAAVTTGAQGAGAGASQTAHMGIETRLVMPADSQAANGVAGIGAAADSSSSGACKAAVSAGEAVAFEGPTVVQPQGAADAGSADPAATKPAAAAAAQTSPRRTSCGTGAEAAGSSSSPAGIIAGYVSAQLAACSEVQDWLQCDQGVAELTLAAQAAGQQLVQGVTNGLFSMIEVEQQLIQALQNVQSAAPGMGSTDSTAAALQAKLPGDLQQVSLQQHEERLLLLLAGALMHALLCCPKVKASVWAVEAAGPEESGARGAVAQPAGSLPHLTQLPALLMKAARGDMPVWLLRQLRVWMQQATLGCH